MLYYPESPISLVWIDPSRPAATIVERRVAWCNYGNRHAGRYEIETIIGNSQYRVSLFVEYIGRVNIVYF